LLHALAEFAQHFAERYGGPGLAFVAFLDSSFLSLPEVSDLLIVFFVVRDPEHWLYYGLLTTVGSVAGCYALYELGRRGGHNFIMKRFHERHVDRALDWFKRYGLFVVIVPSILPPPTPFKIFVLLAGVADVRPISFISAVVIGRGFRYIGEAWLAYRYGDDARVFIEQNLPQVSIALALFIGIVGTAVIVWRRRLRRGDTPSPS
jgi:membrane protein YqaA with SNARE-associated domain